ncbi:MAG: response regulator [Propionicimonas sp.]
MTVADMPPPVGVGAGQKAISVLVVEDEQSVAESLAFLLRLDGYVVHWVATGSAALSLFDAIVPDLVLLDLMLPEVDGLDVCRGIRKRSQVPIIMVTARDSPDDRARGMRAGADDYVTKPYSIPQLRVTIQAVMSRRWQAESMVDRTRADPAPGDPVPTADGRWGRVGRAGRRRFGRRIRGSGTGPVPAP